MVQHPRVVRPVAARSSCAGTARPRRILPGRRGLLNPLVGLGQEPGRNRAGTGQEPGTVGTGQDAAPLRAGTGKEPGRKRPAWPWAVRVEPGRNRAGAGQQRSNRTGHVRTSHHSDTELENARIWICRHFNIILHVFFCSAEKRAADHTDPRTPYVPRPGARMQRNVARPPHTRQIAPHFSLPGGGGAS